MSASTHKLEIKLEKRDFCKQLLITTLTGLGIVNPQLSTAQTTYPSKPIRMLVGFAAGGPTDNAARLIAGAMSKHLGQTITVENRPGANALLAVNELIRSKPDGYTILLASNGSMTVGPARISKLPYEVKRDFTLIGLTVAYPHVLVVPASTAANDFPSFLRLAKERNSELNGASVGHVNDLTIEWLNKLAKLKITRVPYKGDAAVVNDLVSNRVDFALLAPNVALPLVDGKKLKAIALTASGGGSTPTYLKPIKDSGLPEFEVEIWNCLVAPIGTPPDILSKIAVALRKAQESPEIQSTLALAGMHVQLGTAETLSQRIDKEIALWQKVAREAGMPMLEQ